MIYFLNNLNKTVSFKILSFFGYITILFWIVVFYTVDAGMFEILKTQLKPAGFTLIYKILFSILFIIGIIEYQKKKTNFTEQKNKLTLFLFCIGIIVPPILYFVITSVL